MKSQSLSLQMKLIMQQHFPVALFIMLYQIVFNFWVCRWNPKVWRSFKWNLLSSTFLFTILCKVVQTFESVDEILKCLLQMKSTEYYFPVVLFIMLYKVVLILSLWMKSLSVTIQMKSTE